MKKGKPFVHSVCAMETIPGIVEEGCIYKFDELKRSFPYLDLNNEDYFKTMYYDKHKLGCKVIYVGKRGIILKRVVYEVCEVMHEIKDNLLYTSYGIKECTPDGIYNLHSTIWVDEDELKESETRWILSFSSSRTEHKRPDIHQINPFVYEDKIRGTWREIFVFDKYEQACSVAEMFANNTMDYILDSVKNSGKTILKK